MAVSEKLKDGLIKVGIAQVNLDDLCAKMDRYINEIILFNSAYNLTNTSDYEEIVVNHILDSLSAVKKIQELAEEFNESECLIGDIGSGGGLPGIPLAAALPQFRFVLVERMDKRCAFLENCIALLGLKNVSVMKKEAEKVSAGYFSVATFRAFRPLDKKMIKTLLALIRENGYLAAYKAKADSIQTEMDGIKDLVPEYKTEPLSVPYLTDSDSQKKQKEIRQRNLVLIQKK